MSSQGFTLAKDSVLADATIEQLCLESHYFSSVDDIQIFGVRSEHKARVWDIVKSTLAISVSVSSSQHCHKRRCLLRFVECIVHVYKIILTIIRAGSNDHLELNIIRYFIV